MIALYLNAPEWRVGIEKCRSFQDMLTTSVGGGYAIPKGNAAQCLPGCMVVLLSQDGKLRAEGKLKALTETGEKTGSGMLRYDVHIMELKKVPYSPPSAPLRRTEILVVDE